MVFDPEMTFSRLSTDWESVGEVPVGATAAVAKPTVSQPRRPTGPDSLPGWKRSLAAAIRDPDELLRRLDLPDELRLPAREAARLFPVVVPESYLARMRRGDPHDPLLRQVLPLGAELHAVPGFTADAVGDAAARKAPGLLHKYAGRALLIAARECAVHCRYCFRRHYPYGEEPASAEDWTPAIDALHTIRPFTKSSSAAATRWCFRIVDWSCCSTGSRTSRT